MLYVMDLHAETIRTYDTSASALAVYFAGIGARTDDIDLAIRLSGQGAASRVVEIGCGDGRDAAEIIPRVAWYEGFDPSEGLLNLAQAKLPAARFTKADALTYDYPDNLDVVFAFASLLHVNRDDFSQASQTVADALRVGGIFFLSLKERASYQEEWQSDRFGDRMFYYYTPQVVEELAGNELATIYEDHQTIGTTSWFTLALQKS